MVEEKPKRLFSSFEGGGERWERNGIYSYSPSSILFLFFDRGSFIGLWGLEKTAFVLLAEQRTTVASPMSLARPQQKWWSRKRRRGRKGCWNGMRPGHSSFPPSSPPFFSAKEGKESSSLLRGRSGGRQLGVLREVRLGFFGK